MKAMLLKASHLEEHHTSPTFFSPKPRKKTEIITHIPDYEKADIRNMIYNFHITGQCRVTLPHPQTKQQQEFEWAGRKSSLYKIIKNNF